MYYRARRQIKCGGGHNNTNETGDLTFEGHSQETKLKIRRFGKPIKEK